MKGLLLKDLYAMRRSLPVFLLLIVVFAAPGGGGASFILFYAIVIPINLISIDERDRFDGLLMALPAHGAALVASKYILSYGYMCVTLLVAAARGALSQSLLPGAQQTYWANIGVSLALALAMEAVILPILYRFGMERGRPLCVLAILVAAALLGALSGLTSEIPPAPALVPAALAVGALLNAASMPLSARLYERRMTA